MRSLWVAKGFCLTRLNPLCFITYITAKTNSQIKIKSSQHFFLSPLPIAIATSLVDKLKSTDFTQIKLMRPEEQVYQGAFGVFVFFFKRGALMSMT